MYKVNNLFAKISNHLKRILSSKYFFTAIIVLIALQGLWYVVSIKPGLFDEARHIGAIRFNSTLITPFVSSQDPKWDSLGDLVRDPSYGFYYSYSIIARLVKVATSSDFQWIIVLRLITLSIFIVGVFIYKKILLRLGSTGWLANTSLLIFAMLPQIAVLPGAINYDSVMFTMCSLMVFLGLKISQDRSVPSTDMAYLCIVGLLASVVKPQSLAVFLPVGIFVAHNLYTKHRSKLANKLKSDFVKNSWINKAIIIITLSVSMLIFIERPLYNIIRYQKYAPQTACVEILGSKDRCAKNYTASRNLRLQSKKADGFQPASPQDYAVRTWSLNMINTLLSVNGRFDETSFIFRNLFGVGGLVSVVLILLYFRELYAVALNRLGLVTVITYVATLFVANYLLYAKLGAKIAISGRYLLPVLPLIIYFALIAAKSTFSGKFRNIALPILTLLLIVCFSQGGGFLTTLMTHKSYWPNNAVSSGVSGGLVKFVEVIHISR